MEPNSSGNLDAAPRWRRALPWLCAGLLGLALAALVGNVVPNRPWLAGTIAGTSVAILFLRASQWRLQAHGAARAPAFDLAQVQGALTQIADQVAQARTALQSSDGAVGIHADRVRDCAHEAKAASGAASSAMSSEGPVAALSMSVQVLMSGVSGLFDDALRDKQDLLARMDALSGLMKDLQARAEEVMQIAMQTNLLALNAAIEAARAGPEGRGFSVVAHEVRNLSNRSRDSGEHMSQTISSIAQQILDTVAFTRQAIENQQSSAATSNEAIEQINQDFQATTDALAGLAARLVQSSEQVDQELAQLLHEARAAQDSDDPLSGLCAQLLRVREQISPPGAGSGEFAYSADRHSGLDWQAPHPSAA